jgi:hypothetical protein
MSDRDRSNSARRLGRWALATVVLGYLAGTCWLRPLSHPRGVYGGCYRISDVQTATVLSLFWLATFALILAPVRCRRRLAIRLGAAGAAALLTAAFCDLTYTLWSVHLGHVLCGRHAFPRATTLADAELIFKHKPGVSWRGRKTPECQLVDFRTDENGFRNPPGVRRADLVFVGDSVTEAGEVVEELTFARKTGAALGATAVNLGVFCYGPQQELAVLKRYGFAYQPRVVVWQVTEWNDLADAERYRRIMTRGAESPRWDELYEGHSPVARAIAKLFPAKPKHAVDFARSDGTVDRRVIWPYENPVVAHPDGLAETLRVLAEARAECRRRGVGFVVLLVPSAHRVLAPYIKPNSVEEARRYHPTEGPDAPNDLAHALDAFSRANDCAFVDVTAELRRLAERDNRDVFVKNDTHLGAAAHEAVARSLTGCLGAWARRGPALMR